MSSSELILKENLFWKVAYILHKYGIVVYCCIVAQIMLSYWQNAFLFQEMKILSKVENGLSVLAYGFFTFFIVSGTCLNRIAESKTVYDKSGQQ